MGRLLAMWAACSFAGLGVWAVLLWAGGMVRAQVPAHPGPACAGCRGLDPSIDRRRRQAAVYVERRAC